MTAPEDIIYPAIDRENPSRILRAFAVLVPVVWRGEAFHIMGWNGRTPENPELWLNTFALEGWVGGHQFGDDVPPHAIQPRDGQDYCWYFRGVFDLDAKEVRIAPPQ